MFNGCPACGGTVFVDSGIALPEGRLAVCPSCGQLVSQADESIYQETMRRFDDGAQVDRNPRVHIRRLKRVLRYWREAPCDTRIVDVGASFGTFLEQLNAAGFRASGVEPSGSAAGECRAKGLDVYHGFLEDAKFPDASVDVITLYEVIEHLRDPMPLLAECRRVLAPGGMLFMSTGSASSWTALWLKGKWDYFSMLDGGQGHITFYSPRTIGVLAERSGFKVKATESRRVKFVNKLYHKGLVYAAGKVMQELAAPVAKLLNRGHDMLVVLEKP